MASEMRLSFTSQGSTRHIGTSEVTRCSQMNHEESGGMEFYFPARDHAPHWIRTLTLYSPAARQRQITVRTLFRQEEIGASVPVLDQFEAGFYFRKLLHSLCLSAGVPYLIDLDDLIWELPGFLDLVPDTTEVSPCVPRVVDLAQACRPHRIDPRTERAC